MAASMASPRKTRAGWRCSRRTSSLRESIEPAGVMLSCPSIAVQLAPVSTAPLCRLAGPERVDRPSSLATRVKDSLSRNCDCFKVQEENQLQDCPGH